MCTANKLINAKQAAEAMVESTKMLVMQQRQELMNDIDDFVDQFFYEHFNSETELRDELVTEICDMICKRIDP